MSTSYVPFLLLSLCLCISSLAFSADKIPRLALAKHYHADVEISEYYVSEKLDGVRGYWDGQQLFTRNGNHINAPQWFTKNWPKQKLDGELWIGRSQFEKTSAIIRRKKSDERAWRQVKFMVFDLHDKSQSFIKRLQRMRQLISASSNEYIKLIPQRRVADKQSLQRWLSQVVNEGGEGLMLHKANALYTAGRSNDILKLKPHWDAEAKVLAYLPGTGKYHGLMGALKVEAINDHKLKASIFKIGTGFSDYERANPPPIGSIITYRFHGFTQNGLPRFAAYLRKRPK